MRKQTKVVAVASAAALLAIKAPDSGKTTFKTIDGKRYAFDDDGIMLWGWGNDQSERETDDSGWENATYYLASWEDGAMKTGWQKITVYDDTHEVKTNTWKSGGKRYHFDKRGVMVYEWYNVASTAKGEVASTASS